MDLSFATATEADAAALFALRVAVAAQLTRDHGRGHWSSVGSEHGVVRGIRTSHVIVARLGGATVGTLRLASKKPWAIDTAYFTDVGRALYLTDMAVTPARQRRGIGRRLMERAREVARGWPSGAIRLDAYDDAAGAGGFYEKCGLREVGRVTYRRVPLIYFEWLL